MALLEGFEPPTNGFEGHYSIQLSYRSDVFSSILLGNGVCIGKCYFSSLLTYCFYQGFTEIIFRVLASKPDTLYNQFHINYNDLFVINFPIEILFSRSKLLLFEFLNGSIGNKKALRESHLSQRQPFIAYCRGSES